MTDLRDKIADLITYEFAAAIKSDHAIADAILEIVEAQHRAERAEVLKLRERNRKLREAINNALDVCEERETVAILLAALAEGGS